MRILTNDAEKVADALNNIAEAINRFADVMAGDVEEPSEDGRIYMDGTPIGVIK